VAISLVSAGALTSSTAASVTPPFGQSTTAGSLLVCCAFSTTNTAFSITGPSGWVNANAVGGSGFGVTGRIEIWYKPNCAAGETAPTVNCTLATLMDAEVTEWAGAVPVSPFDVGGNTIVSFTVTTSGPVDGGGGGLGVTVFGALTATPTSGGWTPGAGWTNLANDFSSLVVGHFASDYLLNPPTQTLLSEAGTVTGFTPTLGAALIATFLPADVPITYARGAN